MTVPKSRAADVAAVFEITPAPSPQAVLIAEDPFGPKATVEALYDNKPDAALLSRVCGYKVKVAKLPDQDWIKKSQTGRPPVRAGRFFIYGAHDKGKIPHGVIAIRIEAGMAFGTGHHETTALCLRALSELARERRFDNVLDLGCGTGLIAIAAAKLWRQPVLASDIDPVAIEVTNENARENGEASRVRAVLADGFDNATIRAAAPFDLIVANILSAPLTKLAKPLAAALAPDGIAVLSGLMRDEENLLLRSYRRQGLVRKRTLRVGPWSALILSKRRRRK